jgi:3-oxoacyl-[acyl-carrier-protein] synthase III
MRERRNKGLAKAGNVASEKRSPVARRALRLVATGHAVPDLAVSSEQLDLSLGHPAGYIARLSGVRQRYRAAQGQTAAQLAARAVENALQQAGLSPGKISALVACSATMDQGMPCNAALIHAELGMVGIPAFDINSSCLGFLTALDQMSWPLLAGRYDYVVLVASDIASCGLNWQQLESSAIFGDGAAAVIIGRCGPGQSSAILSSGFITCSQGAHWCEIPGGGSRYHPSRTPENFMSLCLFRMLGKKLFRWARAELPGFIDNVLNQACLTRKEIDWVVPHQASHLALEYVANDIGFSRDRVVNIYPDFGNQVAASLPTALDVAVRDGRIRRGHRLLLLGTGAGVAAGALILEY